MDTSSVDLPDEIIELILSRCPLKSLVRFKSVSKSWQSIISNPRFSRIRRIQLSKLAKNHNKFFISAWPIFHICDLSRLAEDGKFRTESELDYPCELIPLSSCDGLILFGLFGVTPRTHPEAFRSWPDVTFSPLSCHIYFDSIVGDYNILFAYINCYTVYSCKSGIWGEIKNIPDEVVQVSRACYDRCIYSKNNDEVVFFDVEDGKVHKFPLPNDVKGLIKVGMGEVSERLCLVGSSEDHRRIQMWVMEVREKNGRFENSWKKLISMDKEEPKLSHFSPMCLTDEDLVVLIASVSKDEDEDNDDSKYFIHNPRKKQLPRD